MKISETTNSDQKKVFCIEGVIDERVDFSATPINSTFPDLHLDLFSITRINSIGTKKWISFFETLTGRGCNLHFYRVPSVIVGQLNLISNFSCGATIHSVALPYSCSSCNEVTEIVKTTPELKNFNGKNPSDRCPACGVEKLVFDEDAEDYLQFLAL